MSLKFVWKPVFIKSFHTKIDIEGVCDGICFLYKNGCFSRFIKLILIQTIKKKFKKSTILSEVGFHGVEFTNYLYKNLFHSHTLFYN